MGELLWTNQLADPAVLTQMLGCLYPIDFLIFFFNFIFKGFSIQLIPFTEIQQGR